MVRLSDPELRRWRERFLLEMEFPGTFPAYAALRIDPDGHLWVRSYPRSGESGAEWSVFGPDGEWLGTVSMPAGLEVFEIGRDYVLGRWKGEFDVDHVRLHRLIRADVRAGAGSVGRSGGPVLGHAMLGHNTSG